jgi:hypothetical protein
MTLRNFSTWLSAGAIVVTGVTILMVQPALSQNAAPATNREKLRAEVIKLRTETEMLRFDYELARERVLEQLKMARSMMLGGQLIGAVSRFQVSINEAQAEAGSLPPGRPLNQARKQAVEEENKKAELAAEQANRKAEAELAKQEATFIADEKKELIRLYTLLAQKQMDLEDAQKRYAEGGR